MTLEEARAGIGQKVLYTPYAQSLDLPETGVITSVGERSVFVCYGEPGSTPAATDPDLLTLHCEISAGGES